jgi:hypothetical protein
MYSRRKKPAPKPRRSILKWMLVAVVILALAGGATYWLLHRSDASDSSIRSTNSINYSPPTDEEKAEADKQKDEIVGNPGDPSKPADGQPPDAGDPAPVGNISVSITRVANATSTQPLSIRALVSGTSSGTCKVSLTKNGQPTVVKTFTVVFEATSATCGSADIPASEFGASGDWTMSLVVQSGPNVSATIKQTVSITK